MGKIRGWTSINHIGDDIRVDCIVDSPNITSPLDAAEQALVMPAIEEEADPIYELDDSGYVETGSTSDYLDVPPNNFEKEHRQENPVHSCSKPESEQEGIRNESTRQTVNLIQDEVPANQTAGHQDDMNKTERICHAIAQLEPTFFEDDSSCYCDITETSKNIIQSMINLVSTEDLDSFRILEELQAIAIKQGRLASKHSPRAKSPNLNALIELVCIKSAPGEVD